MSATSKYAHFTPKHFQAVVFLFTAHKGQKCLAASDFMKQLYIMWEIMRII